MICNICYISNILTVGSEPVISFFNRANQFRMICSFRFYDICKKVGVGSG